MAVCPNCGEDNPERARLCMMCGTALAEAPREQAEERKVVSVLFVDLVGFTARSHDLDAEDVRAALAPYHRLLKREIEAFGGTVEKFIGDAVMAVFGAPVAREDDAERAVRAALRITEAIEELNQEADLGLAIRSAVNSGEGLVSLAARPLSGEGMVTGDVVNTASRLQGVAPVNGIVVGEITYRSTKDFIIYEELYPVSVKGKPDPIPIWRALAARGRFGVDVETRYQTPFIGRDFDLATLKTAYQRTVRESSLQLVTLVGEPGVGKSRLLAEFFSFIDDQEELVTWRQGRSLPYGEGITFWALGEIVKAQAGINESDSAEVAADKIAAVLGGLAVDEADRAWVQSRLGSLVGATSAAGDSAEREEAFTAWIRFLEAIATKGPLVLVFEDLHWAGQSMLEFIEHLVEWSTGVPILIVCTARPELFETHPAWAAGSRNATTISLSPLTDSETAQLISALLSQAVLPAEIHAALLERAGGNPLYAEEFVRMLSDRGILQQKGRVLTLDSDASIPMPENVHALIAARLDTLSSERKSLLHDAAVVGKVFWSGAIAAVGEVDEAIVRRGLHELVRKELVRPARTSSMEGNQEYAFWHALVRDVSYSQIPRSLRARKHRAVAEWIEAQAGERVSDHAEVLAHHYSEALTLAKTLGDAAADRLICPTRRFLALAGERSSELDAKRARAYYQEALDLWDSDDTAKAEPLLKAARLSLSLGLNSEAEECSRKAFDLFRRAADAGGQVKGLIFLSATLAEQGRAQEGLEAISDARVLAERDGSDEAVANADERVAQHLILNLGSLDEGLAAANRALSRARAIGLKDVEARALLDRGMALCEAGDAGGISDIRLGAAKQEQMNLRPEGIGAAFINLGDYAWLIEGPSSGLQAKQHAVHFCTRRGRVGDAMWARSESLRMLFDMGEWDQLESEAQEILAWSSRDGARTVEIRALPYIAAALLHTGRGDEASAATRRIEEILGGDVDPEGMVAALAVAAMTRAAAGDSATSVQFVTRLAEVTAPRPSWWAWFLPTAMRVLAAAGELALAEQRLIDEADVGATRDKNSVVTATAVLREAQGQSEDARDLYEEAARRWADYGYVLEEGQAHLGLARCLIALGDHEAATAPLHKAKAIFSRLGALPLVNETDNYLGRAEAAS